MGMSKQSSLRLHREITYMGWVFFAVFTMHFPQLMRQGTLKRKSSFTSPAVGAEAIKTERKAYLLAWFPYVYKIATRHTRCHKLASTSSGKVLPNWLYSLPCPKTPNSFVLWLPRMWSQGVAERRSNCAKDNPWTGDLLGIGPSLHVQCLNLQMRALLFVVKYPHQHLAQTMGTVEKCCSSPAYHMPSEVLWTKKRNWNHSFWNKSVWYIRTARFVTHSSVL